MPKSHSPTRNGADAAFAKAMARAEFGRFYTDERDLQEVRRSMARRQRRGPHGVDPLEAAPNSAQSNAGPKPAKTKAAALRPTPRARERRTELAEALAKLREAAKQH